MKKIKIIFKPLVKFGLVSLVGITSKNILGSNLTVFCYHDVTDSPSDFSHENFLNVTPKTFEYQIKYIKKNFNLIQPSQLSQENLPSNAALVTFDDGFKSFFTNAIPILEKHKIPSIIFLNMGPILGEIFWPGLIVFLCNYRPDFEKYLKSQVPSKILQTPIFLSCTRKIVEDYLGMNKEDLSKTISDYVGEFANASDLKNYSSNEYVYYANHSYSHYLSCSLNDDEFINDIEKNSMLLRKFPNYIDFFAFPFGQPNTTFKLKQVELLINNEFKKVFYSSSSNINHSSQEPFLDRINLVEEDNSSYKIKYKVVRPWFLTKIRTFSNNFFKKN